MTGEFYRTVNLLYFFELLTYIHSTVPYFFPAWGSGWIIGVGYVS